MMKRTKEHFHILLPEGYKRVLKITAAKAALSISDLVKLALDNHLRELSSPTQGSETPQRSSEDGSKAYDKSD